MTRQLDDELMLLYTMWGNKLEDHSSWELHDREKLSVAFSQQQS